MLAKQAASILSISLSKGSSPPPFNNKKFSCREEFCLDTDGVLCIRVSIKFSEASEWIDSIPRVGMQFRLPGFYNNVVWLGNGPGESYEVCSMRTKGPVILNIASGSLDGILLL